MRTVTAAEKLRAVNEGKMAKSEFVRQMRQEYPMYVSNFDGFDSTVQILKTRKLISEAPQMQKAFSGVKVYDDRPALTYSLDALERGIRTELAAAGVQLPNDHVTPELYFKAEKKAKDNLEKDANHYSNLMSGESSHTDKNDKMKETKRGAAEKDTFNDMKKASLKENSDITSVRDNIVKVASVIRAKYSEIPGFNVILKDFLQTHQDDIKAGLVTDPVAEFDDYIDLNYDRLDEKEEVNERGGHYGQALVSVIKDMAADFDGDEVGAAEEAMEFIGQEYEIDFEFGAGPSRMAEKKGKDHDKDGDIDSDDYMMAKDKAIKKAMGKDDQIKEAIKTVIKKVLSEQTLNEAATNELARLAEDYQEFEGMKQTIVALENIVTEIETFYDKTRDKIQKIYDSIGEVRNEEGLKVGAFLAPAIEAAFNKDLRPITKKGFTGDLEIPKVKTMSSREFEDLKQQQGIDEEPKQTVFTPIGESKKNK